MKTTFKYILAVVAFAASSFVAQAQVKIGSNPTVADPTLNLEVEASTPNRKVKVDKTTGQVTIQDGTEGTAKILTSDAVGGASWQKLTIPATSLAPFSSALTQIRQTMTSSVGPTVGTTIVFQGESSDAANAFNPAAGTFTAPSAGYYIFFGSTQFDNSLVAGTPPFNSICLRLLAQSSNFAQACAQPGTVVASASVSNVVHLNAGDVVTLQAAATSASGSIYQVVVSSFYGYKIAD